MVGTVLIIDDSATSRIVLKVQLAAVFRDVLQAATAEEGLACARRDTPGVILISDSVAPDGAAPVIRALREAPGTAQAAIVALTERNDRNLRSRLIAAGADEIFSRRQSEILLHARLRCLLRVRGAEEELRLRDGTGRSLGLAEPVVEFERPGAVAIIAHRSANALQWHHALSRLSRHRFMPVPLREAVRWFQSGAGPEIVIIDLDGTDRKAVLRLIADIRSQPATRHAEVVLLTSDHGNPILADALDQGATAVLPFGFDPRETLAQVDALLRRKRRSDRMRRSLQDGLRAAVTDPLTGLYNRRYAQPYLERMVAEARRSGRPFTLALADIDRFKQINDRYGHPAGDAALVMLADLLRDNLRAPDLVVRFGGEEFLIVMPDTRPSEARIVADRLRERVEAAEFTLPGAQEPVRLTLSIGLCAETTVSREEAPETPPAAELVRRIIAGADRALYAAKGAGRNTVSVAPETCAPT